jgi:hypothetical protein
MNSSYLCYFVATLKDAFRSASSSSVICAPRLLHSFPSGPLIGCVLRVNLLSEKDESRRALRVLRWAYRDAGFMPIKGPQSTEDSPGPCPSRRKTSSRHAKGQSKGKSKLFCCIAKGWVRVRVRVTANGTVC